MTAGPLVGDILESACAPLTPLASVPDLSL
jgi:hypothetical protein